MASIGSDILKNKDNQRLNNLIVSLRVLVEVYHLFLFLFSFFFFLFLFSFRFFFSFLMSLVGNP